MDSAPVKAPLLNPKNSLSRRFSGMAPQLTEINGPLLLLLNRWIPFATSSLPVPLSPVINTVVSYLATLFARSNNSFISRLSPIISSNPSPFCNSSTFWRSRLFSFFSCALSSAFFKMHSISSSLNGFVIKSYAPTFIA